MSDYAKTIKEMEPRVYTREHVPFIPKGLQYPSVTTIQQSIAKPMLYAWYAACGTKKVKILLELLTEDVRAAVLEQISQTPDGAKFLLDGREQSQAAKDIGTMTHDSIEKYWESGGKVLDFEKPCVKAGEAFAHWLHDWEIEPVAWETKVASNIYQYAGRVDLIARVRKRGSDEKWRMCVIDIKVATAIYEENKLQLSAYHHAIEEMMEVKIAGQFILRLDKETGKYEFKEMPFDLNGFLGAQQCWLSLNPKFTYEIPKKEIAV